MVTLRSSATVLPTRPKIAHRTKFPAWIGKMVGKQVKPDSLIYSPRIQKWGQKYCQPRHGKSLSPNSGALWWSGPPSPPHPKFKDSFFQTFLDQPG